MQEKLLCPGRGTGGGRHDSEFAIEGLVHGELGLGVGGGLRLCRGGLLSLAASMARMISKNSNAITTSMISAVPIQLRLVSSPLQQGRGAGLAEQGAAEVGARLVKSGEGAVDEQAAGERGPLPQPVDVDPLHRGGG